MKGLTDRQREVLDFIAQFTEDNAYPPTVREIGEHFSISLRAVQDHVAALKKKGYLSLSQKRSRSIRVLKDERFRVVPSYSALVPVVGVMPAGRPLLSKENVEGRMRLTEPMIASGKSYFVLRVQDSSMSAAGILEGDLAVIEQRPSAEDGQVVAAVVDDVLTLKRFFQESSRVRLQPENPEFQALYSQNVHIAGVLSAIVRTY